MSESLIGALLADARKRCRLSQEKVSSELGVSISTLHRIETDGADTVTYATVRKLAKYYVEKLDMGENLDRVSAAHQLRVLTVAVHVNDMDPEALEASRTALRTFIGEQMLADNLRLDSDGFRGAVAALAHRLPPSPADKLRSVAIL